MPPRKDHFAIAIGIDWYPSLRPLTSAVGDATRFCEWLTDPDGGNLDPENVKLVKSPSEEAMDRFDARPIQDEIDRVLRDFGAERNERLGSRLYFYFAGHGFGPAFDEVGMVMANASMTSLVKNNIGLREYRVYFHDTGLFDEVIYILDCCRDNARSKRTNPPGFDDAGPAANRAPRVNDYVILGAAFGDKAFSPVDKTEGERRGILTTALLEALSGDMAAIDPGGRITSATLEGFLRERVKALATVEQLKQEPQIFPSPDLVIHQIDPGRIPRVTIHVIAGPQLTSGDLVIVDNDMNEIDRRPVGQARETAPWEVHLPANSPYVVQHSEDPAAVNRFINTPVLKVQPHVVRL